MKINKLTTEQEKQLPIFRQNILDITCNGMRIDRIKLQSALNDAYALIGKEPPLLIILQSPLQANMAINFLKKVAEKDQLRGQLEDQFGYQLWRQLWRQLRGQLRGRINSTSLYGAHDLFWIAFYKFCENIGVKYTKEQSRSLDINYRISEQCEWWWPYEGICFVSEKPTQVKWDGNVLHNETGPAVLYEDGYAIYSWRGTNIPKEWIKNPETLTPDMAITWENVEYVLSGRTPMNNQTNTQELIEWLNGERLHQAYTAGGNCLKFGFVKGSNAAIDKIIKHLKSI